MSGGGKFSMGDYVEVSERIAIFRDKHPEGSLQSEIVPELCSETRITMKAYAFRTPDDPRPGIGHSSMTLPGSTPYTKGSEMENVETSCWGRAIVAVLAADTKRGIASASEVQKAQGTSRPAAKVAPAAKEEAPAGATIVPQMSAAQREMLDGLVADVAAIKGVSVADALKALENDAGKVVDRWTGVEASQVIGKLKRHKGHLEAAVTV